MEFQHCGLRADGAFELLRGSASRRGVTISNSFGYL